jgi:hypothetical protein
MTERLSAAEAIRLDDEERSNLLAAMLGIYMASELTPAPVGPISAYIPPVGVGEAIQRIRGAKGPFRDRATRVAAARLAVGATLNGRTDLTNGLGALIGQGNTKKIVDMVRGKESPSVDWVMRCAYHVLPGKDGTPPVGPPEEEGPGGDGPGGGPGSDSAAPESKPKGPPGTAALRLTASPPQDVPMDTPVLPAGPVVPVRFDIVGHPETSSKLDIETMKTTVTVTSLVKTRFQDLAVRMDPRSWTLSPAWVAAYKAILVDGRFVRDPSPPPLGTSWSGYLFEYVESNWSGGTVSAFQSYLNIRFTVVPESKIELFFSLHTSQGSLLLTRVAEGGVDIDSGFSKATRRGAGGPPGSENFYDVTTRKNIRFTDILTRSTPNQGRDGAGQVLNYRAPAVVALWMNDLTYEMGV